MILALSTLRSSLGEVGVDGNEPPSPFPADWLDCADDELEFMRKYDLDVYRVSCPLQNQTEKSIELFVCNSGVSALASPDEFV